MTTLCWRDIPGAPQPGFILSRVDDIPDGGAHLLFLGEKPKYFGVILLRSGASVFAYVNRCAHFGVPLGTSPAHLSVKPHQSISCSVHYARYQWRDGVCDYGECRGESLLSIPINIVNGEVIVASS